MFYNKLFFLTLLITIIFCKNAYSATFTVTSNADTGPGTLREALNNAAANGATAQDIIKFNLPGSLVSDRTIRLRSQLPAITSNVIIDGTSQPGIAFGVSDARVIIEPETSPAYYSCLFINGDINNGGVVAKSIEIYGLYIRNFAKITGFANPDNGQGSGIVIQGDASAIIIGAPDKGNVICGNINGILNNSYYYNTGLNDVLIQSNIIGLLDDGYTAASNISGINLAVGKTVTIGGTNANMGNIISANVTNINITRGYYFNATQSAVNIQNNKIGTDYTGKKDFKNILLFQQSAFIKAYGINITSDYTTANISSNIISGQRYAGIYIERATFSITGNKIGTDINGTANLGNGEGIRTGENSSGTIGGTAATDKNYIGYNQYGIEALNSAHTLITRNSIFCNTDYGISAISSYYTVPYVQVLNFSSTAVSGVATPNSAIELFFSDDCGTICQGKTYITTVQSDGSGKWSYSGSISKAVIATATDGNKNTSPFSSLVIRQDDMDVKDYDCKGKGSVTIKQPRSGLLFHWDKKEQNGSLTSIKDGQNVSGLEPGTYQLTVQYPGGCQKVTQLFEIKDVRIKIRNVIAPVPQCRQKQFLFDVNYTGGSGNVTFTWKDKNGNTVATGKTPYLPEGTFTVTISDDAGCNVTSSPPVTIKAKPGPDYDLSTMQVDPARCGVADGGIKNITTTVGIGTLTYKWLDSQGKTVGTSKDLSKVKGGYYTLVLMDQSECSPYSTQPIFISETNSVNITDGFITPAKCGENNGAITGVTVFNADKMQWYDPQGNSIPTNPANLDLYNLADGTYRLNAINTVTKCSNDKYFTVGRLIPEIFTIKNLINTSTTCGLNNGSLHIDFEGKITPSSYKWVDALGNPLSYGTDLPNLAPGSYSLHVTDKNGCPSVLGTWVVQKTPLLQFSTNNAPVTKTDECDQSIGSIKGIDITGGVLPYTFTWTDATGKTVGTDKDLVNVPKDTYSLVVTDATACAVPLTYSGTIDNVKYIPDAPIVADQRICLPDKIAISVLNKTRGTYNLYADATSLMPLQTSTTGNFSVLISKTSDYYISYSIGTCESPRTKTHIEVVLVDVKFSNTITPNGDGVNDYWQITGLEKFPGTVIQLFNRNGQKVFESKEYATPFTGSFNGWQLPAGVYYYIINLNTPCKLLSGNLTLIR